MGSQPAANGPEPISLPSDAQVGAVLAGKYRIDRVLGRGGIGVVVAAHHLRLRQTFAIKLLLPTAARRPNSSARMVREARAVAALKSEHVARVFDVDVLADGSPYIVMEYLEGQTLATRLESRGPLEVPVAVDYMLQACEALAEAHALGIVHRDLKPANLFLVANAGRRNELRVLDFGISKALDADIRGTALVDTDSHAFMGSPPYVSPEQLLNPSDVDARTDIWSLGIVLYECLTARRPFHGDTLARLWDSILRDDMPPIAEDGRSITPALERILRRCLEKAPATRYSSVLELSRDLVEQGPPHARSSLQVVEVASAAPTASETLLELTENGEEQAPSPPEGTATETPVTRTAPVQARARAARVSGLLLLVLTAAALVFVLKSLPLAWKEASRGAGSSDPPASTALPAPAHTENLQNGPVARPVSPSAAAAEATAPPRPAREQVVSSPVRRVPAAPASGASIAPPSATTLPPRPPETAPIPRPDGSETNDEAVYLDRE
jgi:serine/threonine-protein kinase